MCASVGIRAVRANMAPNASLSILAHRHEAVAVSDSVRMRSVEDMQTPDAVIIVPLSIAAQVPNSHQNQSLSVKRKKKIMSLLKNEENNMSLICQQRRRLLA